MAVSTAYWVNPYGKILNIGYGEHHKMMIDNPKQFHTTKEQIQKVYDKYNEPLGKNGKAREEIVKDAVKKGFIRVRLYPNKYWSINVNKLDTHAKKALAKWAENARKDKLAGKYMPVVIDSPTGVVKDYDVNDLYNEKHMNESDQDDSFIPEFVNNINSFSVKPTTFKQFLSESSLSRLYKHSQEHDYGTITAFRSGPDCGKGKPYTHAENIKRNKKLLGLLRSKGYGVTSIKGSYLENYKSKNEKEVKENSFFVSDLQDKGTLKKDLLKFGEQFEQDSIIFGKKGGAGILIGTNKCPDGYPGYGKKVKQGGAIFGKTGEFMSRIRGRPFIFAEDVETKEYGILKYPTELRGAVRDSKIKLLGD